MIRYKALCKVVETGSFTLAAKELGYTQAAVSQMIQSLEKELGLTLLSRRRIGVQLTDEGKKLFPVIQKFVLTEREIFDTVNSINGLETGLITIGTCSSVSQQILPPLISSFGKKNPNIKFVLKQGDNTTMPEWIRSGVIDFGFVYPEASEELYCKELFKDRYVAIVPENSALAKKSEVTLEELASYPFILCEEGIVNTVENAYKREKITLSPGYRINDDNTILSMVECGIGVSIISSLLLKRSEYKVKTLNTVQDVSRTVGVTFKSKESLPIASKKFIDYLFKNISSVLK